jgi:hypothetical protein
MNRQPSEPTSHAAAPATTAATPPRAGLRRFSTAEFLVALALLFVSLPFLENFVYGDVIESLLITLMFALAVVAVGRRRSTFIWAAVLMLPAVVGKWVNHIWPGLVAPQVFPAAGMVFVGFVVAQFLHFILRAPRVNSEVLCAGISTYLLLGLFWMFSYLLVAQLVPDSFAFSTGPPSSHSMTHFNAYYFSFVTLSTVGYGDVTPVSNEARALAVAEAMTGTLYVAVLIARLVALYTTQSQAVEASGRTEANRPNL